MCYGWQAESPANDVTRVVKRELWCAGCWMQVVPLPHPYLISRLACMHLPNHVPQRVIIV